MIWLLLVALVLVAVTVRLLIFAAVFPRLKLALHLRDIDAYGFEAMGPVTGVPGRRSPAEVLAAVAQRTGAMMMRRFPPPPAPQRRGLTAAAIYDGAPETVQRYRPPAALRLSAAAFFCAVVTG